MSIFKKDINKPFRPKTAKLSDIYKYSTGARRDTVPLSVKSKAKNVLSEAGYSQRRISKTVYGDKDTDINPLKHEVDDLHKANLFGFQKSGETLVGGYVRKEVTKRKSIHGLIRDRHLDAMGEPISPDDPAAKKDDFYGRLKRPF